MLQKDAGICRHVGADAATGTVWNPRTGIAARPLSHGEPVSMSPIAL